MPDKLDLQKVRKLLEDADRKWYSNHGGQFKYQEHLDFVADYLARNYKGTTGLQKAVLGTPGKRKLPG